MNSLIIHQQKQKIKQVSFTSPASRMQGSSVIRNRGGRRHKNTNTDPLASAGAFPPRPKSAHGRRRKNSYDMQDDDYVFEDYHGESSAARKRPRKGGLGIQVPAVKPSSSSSSSRRTTARTSSSLLAPLALARVQQEQRHSPTTRVLEKAGSAMKRTFRRSIDSLAHVGGSILNTMASPKRRSSGLFDNLTKRPEETAQRRKKQNAEQLVDLCVDSDSDTEGETKFPQHQKVAAHKSDMSPPAGENFRATATAVFNRSPNTTLLPDNDTTPPSGAFKPTWLESVQQSSKTPKGAATTRTPPRKTASSLQDFHEAFDISDDDVAVEPRKTARPRQGDEHQRREEALDHIPRKRPVQHSHQKEASDKARNKIPVPSSFRTSENSKQLNFRKVNCNTPQANRSLSDEPAESITKRKHSFIKARKEQLKNERKLSAIEIESSDDDEYNQDILRAKQQSVLNGTIPRKATRSSAKGEASIANQGPYAGTGTPSENSEKRRRGDGAESAEDDFWTTTDTPPVKNGKTSRSEEAYTHKDVENFKSDGNSKKQEDGSIVTRNAVECLEESCGVSLSQLKPRVGLFNDNAVTNNAMTEIEVEFSSKNKNRLGLTKQNCNSLNSQRRKSKEPTPIVPGAAIKAAAAEREKFIPFEESGSWRNNSPKSKSNLS